MSKIETTKTNTGSRFRLDRHGDSKAGVLAKVHDCSSGDCTCASDEIQHLQSIAIKDPGDASYLKVRTKSGEGIYSSCVQECPADLRPLPSARKPAAND